MRKSIIAVIIFSFLFVVLMGTAPAFGEAGPVINRTYVGPDDAPLSAPVSYKIVDPGGIDWDLTRGDLKVHYTLDMSAYTPLEEDSTVVSQVGIYGSPGIRFGWMSSCAPEAYINQPSKFDLNDKFFLTFPYSDTAENNYGAYISTGQMGDWANMKLVNTLFPIWAPSSKNYGFYFDRGDASADKATKYGLVDGKTVNTGGKYDVALTYHARSATTGVMFATINGVQQGFYGSSPMTGAPKYTPAGKLFNGAQNRVQVYADLAGDGVKISNFWAEGSPTAPSLVDIWPVEADQGDVVPMHVVGAEFRNVIDPLTQKLGINVDLLKANAAGDGDTEEKISADPVVYDANSNGHRVFATLGIPDEATAGLWSLTYKHFDDPAVARLSNAFTVNVAPPKITGISVNHAKRKQKITMDIKGKFFRNVPMTVQLKRDTEVINATSVTWISKNLVTAVFTIPSTATIGADWNVFLQHNDDSKSSTFYYFSVDVKMDMVPHIIWQHAPFYLSVRLFSETGFDATKINPSSISMGGIIPYWYQLKDMNWDGKKDMEVRFWNSFVTIPIGFARTVAIAGRTSTGGVWGTPIKAFDTVDVFWFLF